MNTNVRQDMIFEIRNNTKKCTDCSDCGKNIYEILDATYSKMKSFVQN